MKRLPLLCSFVLFILLCASVTYWVLQWTAPATRALQVIAPSEPTHPDISAAVQLFGGASAAATVTPLQLSGIVYASKASERVAIIATEAKPARALRLHAEVVPGVSIQQINQSSVEILEHGQLREIRLQPTNYLRTDKANSSGQTSSTQ
jgi:general secretion pathway protein C